MHYRQFGSKILIKFNAIQRKFSVITAVQIITKDRKSKLCHVWQTVVLMKYFKV